MERSSDPSSINENNSNLTLREKLSVGKRKCQDEENNYIACSFILGSVAEVERLWYIAKKILKDNRKGTTHLSFESILFLNINKSSWNEYTVKEAMEEVNLVHEPGPIAV